MILKSYIESEPNGYAPQIFCEYDIAKDFIENHSKRVVIIGPDKKPLHRALQVRKDGYALIMLSRAVLKSWRYEIGDLVEVELLPDTSEFGMAFPEEFQIVLEQDPEATEAFRSRKPGKQRGVLHYIDSGKTETTRIKRALEMADRLKNNALYGEENHK